MTVRQAADDLELSPRRGDLAAQSAADGVDKIRGQVREVSEGLVLDLAVLAVAAS